MKRLLIPPALLGLSALLTACGGGESGGPTPPLSSKFALTVNVTGVSSAPVKITNTASKATVFDGPITGKKTFSDLAAGSVLSVQGGAVANFVTPATQTVTLSSDQSVTLDYKAAAQASAAVSTTLISGRIVGTDLQIGSAFLVSADKQQPLFGKATVVGNALTLDLSKLTPEGSDLEDNFYLRNCTGKPSDPTARMLDSASLSAYSPQGDLMGEVYEKIVAGPDATVPNTLAYRFYSDRDFTFQGECSITTASGTVFTEKNNLKIAKGWNLLSRSVENKIITVRNIAAGNQVQLTFESAEPEVSVFLNPANLEFAGGQTVSANADLIQVGNYSGTVSLSTNIAGVSIEPSTLTLTPLPKLTTQALATSPARRLTVLDLQPQKLSTKLTFKYTGTTSYSNADFAVLVKDTTGKQVGSGRGKLNISRPGTSMFVGGYNLILSPKNSLKIPVQFIDPDRNDRNLTVTAENLPGGVRSTTEVVNTKDTFATANLILTSDASLKPGTYPITITAKGTGYSAMSTINVVTPKPSVYIYTSGGYDAIVAHRNEPGFIQLDIKSQFGFAGQTEIQLRGLPKGVTAPITPVTVAADTTTTVKIPLTVSADAALGNTTIDVFSADRTVSADYVIPVVLTVRPARLALGKTVSSIAAGSSGVWVSSNEETTQGTATIYRHFDAAQKATTTLTLADGAATSLLPLPDGSVLAMSYAQAYQLSDAGVGKTFKVPQNAHTGVSDSQGRIWFIQPDTGNNQKGIARWTPTTGEVKLIVPSTSDSNIALIASNNGKKILYTTNNNTDSLIIDTVTGKSVPVSLYPYVSGAVIGDDATIFFITSGSLKRLNTNGTITTFNIENSFTGLIGLDKISPDMLWSKSYNSVNLFKISSSEIQSISLGEISYTTLLKSGGSGIVTYEYSSSTGFSNYLTLLK
ncbi:hypothetical protein [Deinococcus arenicola]|uniref:Uncharacterized protein n=1 Tax=Deinococcus arenicola TaxID=2994950 RepID=A0ABU4DQU6_9DEIO|nr:hypothetical protein [Deinococcus sp. ZS9-10]MDV6374808.1 hypothetical protein [Deinococcus sp. ZS9-10]